MTSGGSHIREIPLRLAEGDVWSHLGTPGRAHAGLVDDVAEGIELARKLCTPRGACRRLSVKDVGPRSVSFDDGPSLEGKFLAHLFAGAREALFLVVTIGPLLESRVSRLLAEGNVTEAFVLDAVGSAAAMNLLTQVLGEVDEEATARGWDAGVCLSPGQTYWDVTGQQSIFQTAQAEKIGVELLESSFLKPRKSQSAVVPLGPDLAVRADVDHSYCRYCPATRCPLRREPQVAV